MKLLMIISKSNIFTFYIFLLILGLSNAILSSNSLRIFTLFSENFGDDAYVLLPFYTFVIIFSLITLLLIKIFKLKYILFLKILVLIYLVSFFTPIILFTESNEIIKTLIIYALITTFFLLLDHFFKNKKSYLNFLLKFSLVISLSTLIIDLYHIYKYQNDPFKNIQAVLEKNEKEIKYDNLNLGTKNVFYIIFDRVSPIALLEKSNLKSNLFFKKINDGIYFNNAWTNGHRTAVSVNQHLNGYFSNFAKPFIHHNLKNKKIISNYFLYNRHCTNRHSLSCYDVKELTQNHTENFFNNFYFTKMTHAIELRFNLPIFRIFNFSNFSHHIEKFEQKNKSIKSFDLLNLQIKKFDDVVFKGMEKTYNFMYFYPPHHPYVYDSKCKLKGDTSAISKDLSIEKMDYKLYLEQVRCMNKTILKLFEILKKKNLYNNSLIIVTSDHSVGSIDTALKNKTGINKVKLENLEYIKKHQNFFNNITDTRAKIPLWIKPAFYKKGLRSDSRLIFSLDLPTTVLGAFKLKKESLPGLDILDLNVKKEIFNKRSKMMVLYGQYNEKFQPFTYLIKDKKNWTIINSEKAKKIAKNKFFID